MKTKVLLFILFTTTLFSIGTLITMLFNTTPDDPSVLTIFYGSIFVLVFGLVFFIGYGINRYRFQALPPWQQTATVFRYGALLGLFLVLNLLVSAYIGLSWPLFIVLLALVFFAEVAWRKKGGVKLP